MPGEWKFPDVVDLNVGGRHLTTSLSTLTKYPDSMLAAMFSGKQPVTQDKDGRYFIDVDGDVFVHVLNFLRFGKMPPPERASGVREYAEYFGLQELKELLPKDFEKVLSGIWKMKLPNYQSYWKGVEREILNLSSKYFYIYVSAPDACSAGSRRRTLVLQAPGSSNIINLDLSYTDDERPRPTVLLNLLANDLKNLNIFTDYHETECVQCGCKAAMHYNTAS
ncbi:BTB/POZ domain-containing protein KCTD7-like [Haliotis cracherodii]|uniref:BTB/POZ domain-containing protein KCTD7-like n=1 Tax=Haliotis cracherodii TaxID=6455 RepID=UPI0039ECB7A9